MKKVVSIILIVICCALLTGCGESGDFYVEFMATDAPEDGWYQITAEAHVEEALPLVYLQAQAETEIDMEFTLTGNKGLFWLVYVQADGTEQELLSVAGSERALPAVWNCSLPLDTESGHLEFRTSQSADLQFELVLSNMDGVDIAMRSPLEDEKWHEMKEGLPELNPSLGGSSQGVNNHSLVLQAGEHFSFAYPSPQEEDTLGLMAWLAEPTGDLQLVYVQPDGVDKLLWSSEGRDEWLINLEIDLMPGEGLLEWRSENGCECTLNFLIEYSEEAGVTGFSA